MLSMKFQFSMITYAELSKATNDFLLSDKIGQGSCNVMSKGLLGENGTSVVQR